MLLFPKAELEQLAADYEVPQFNQAYIARRKNMVDFYFFDKPLTVNDLKWPTPKYVGEDGD